MFYINYPKHRYTGEKPWMNRDWLYEQYVTLDRSTKDIANEYGCKRNTIQCWLAKYKIKKDHVKREYVLKYKFQDKDYLYDEYINKEKSVEQIAKDNGSDINTVRYYMRKFDIEYECDLKRYTDAERREMCDLYINQKLSSNQVADIFGASHGTVLKILKEYGYDSRSLQESQYAYNNKELDRRLLDKDWLIQKHFNENLSCKDIGKILGTDGGSVIRQMKKFGIQYRDGSESKIGLMKGSKHHNWKGGKSNLYSLVREYSQTNIFPKAKERDGYTCQLCGKTQDEAILHVHHINPFINIYKEILDEHPEYDKSNPEDKQKLYDIIVNDARFTDMNNLVTYCKDCHLFKIHKYHKRNKTISNQATDNVEGSETIESAVNL